MVGKIISVKASIAWLAVIDESMCGGLINIMLFPLKIARGTGHNGITLDWP